jgi:signal transduction histidine kinase
MEERANILVVDDDLGPRESMRMILKPLHNVYTAEDGGAALRMIQEKPIDLVTLDLKMPGITGIDVLKEIKRINPNIEVIIVTGYGTLKTATEAMKYGVNSYITKPYNLNEITSLIDRAIERRRFNRKLRHFFEEALFSDEGGIEEEERLSDPLSLTENGLEYTDRDKELLDVTELKFKKMKEMKEDFSKEIKILEERLIRSERLSIVGQLAAGYAHELNNGLSTMLGYTQFVQHKIESNHPELSDLLDNLATISNQIERTSNITQSLLDLSRKKPSEKEPTDVQKLIDQILSYVEYRTQSLGIKVERHYEPHLPLISVDPRRVEQVFLNLIINAFQAMPEGGTIRITASCTKDKKGDAVKLEFADSGKGIAEQNLKKVFDPFFSTRDGSGGTGLGLFISRRMVENYQGTIEVVSKKDKGTTFIIKFPSL